MTRRMCAALLLALGCQQGPSARAAHATCVASEEACQAAAAAAAPLEWAAGEAEVEEAEAAEADLLDMRLLQTSLSVSLRAGLHAPQQLRSGADVASVVIGAEGPAANTSAEGLAVRGSAAGTGADADANGTQLLAVQLDASAPALGHVSALVAAARLAVPAAAEAARQQPPAPNPTAAPAGEAAAAAAVASAIAAAPAALPVAVPPKKVHAAAVREWVQGGIPVGAIVIGILFLRCSGLRVCGLLSVYFGIQTGLNLYMKIVLSNATVSLEHGMRGVPGAFLITALQQLVSFSILVPAIALLWPTPWRYTPKPLKTRRAWAGILGLSMTFALNIGLNNLCLSLLPMSINLMIRSCIPLATWLMQSLVSLCIPGGMGGGTSGSMELTLMLVGVFFAGMASVAKEEGSAHSGDAKDLGAGIFVGVLSLVACSLYLIFAQWLGQDVKLNPLDMTLYMSVPAALFLLPLILFLQHPVGWKGFGPMTDWEVLQQVLAFSPFALALVALSGVFAIFYNTLQYSMVSELSATHTAFAGNFNKAATIVLSLALGLESLPEGFWGEVTIFSIAGGISAFTAYSVVRSGPGKSGH